MNRDDLLRELTALDFVAVDLNLYLNTHPMDCEAIPGVQQGNPCRPAQRHAARRKHTGP